MRVGETAFAGPRESPPVKKTGESWLEALRRWLVRCPQCSEVWLVVGARENAPYVCKGCGHRFAISFGAAPVRGS